MFFPIADFDDDDFISSADLRECVNKLTGEQHLSDEDMQQLIDNVSDTVASHGASLLFLCLTCCLKLGLNLRTKGLCEGHLKGYVK